MHEATGFYTFAAKAQHTHVQVISKRQDAAPMQMKLSSDIDAQQGFILDHGGYSKSQQEGNMKAKRYFIPPCTIRSSHSALRGLPHSTSSRPWFWIQHV